MKILTLNTHSKLENGHKEKLNYFVNFVADTMPDVIALQEVNQSADSAEIAHNKLCRAIGSVPLKKDNHALEITELLYNRGIEYNCIWSGVKLGYNKFDEGLAIMARKPISNPKFETISRITNYTNWKTRGALMSVVDNTLFCTTHLGWWDDEEEPFCNQFATLNKLLSPFSDVILLGDFNSPDNAEGEGYSLILSSGWYDLYTHAHKRYGHITIPGKIAGWENAGNYGLRIDYIFSKCKFEAASHSTVLDGIRGNTVSDHFGIMVTI